MPFALLLAAQFRGPPHPTVIHGQALLGRADVYVSAQGYPLFTMSRKPPVDFSTAENCSLAWMEAGGARRDRTDDLKLAKLALSQLSYGPSGRTNGAGKLKPFRPITSGVVGLGRFELPTSRLSSARSNQLSYRPKAQASMRRKRNEDGGVPLCSFKQDASRSFYPACPSRARTLE